VHLVTRFPFFYSEPARIFSTTALIEVERAASEIERLSIPLQSPAKTGADAARHVTAVPLAFDDAGLAQDFQVFRHVVLCDTEALFQINRVQRKPTGSGRYKLFWRDT